MRRPNLFIVGAPKTGTTALASWLASHPNVTFSTRKEPNYFSTDIRILNRLDEDAYLKLFSGATSEHKYLAEGSTRYLYSKIAIPEIERCSNEPKLIAIVRNPVEVVASLHNHLVFLGVEQHSDLGIAWRLSSARAEGKGIVPNCSDPDSLIYSRIGSLGEQIQRFFEHTPKHRRLVMMYDDLQLDPAAFYRQAIEFLGLKDDCRQDFSPVNVSMKQRSHLLGRTIDLLASIKSMTGIKSSVGLLEPLARINRVDQARNKIPAELACEIFGHFKEDVALLSELIGRDLSHWEPR